MKKRHPSLPMVTTGCQSKKVARNSFEKEEVSAGAESMARVEDFADTVLAISGPLQAHHNQKPNPLVMC